MQIAEDKYVCDKTKLRQYFLSYCRCSSYDDTVKGKGHPRTGHEDTEGEEKYSSTHSLTSRLESVGGQRLPPEREPVPIEQEAG